MNPLLKKCHNAARRRVKELMGHADDNRAFDAVLLHFLKNKSPQTIFDVGAHQGESIRRYLKIFPQARIHSFEPDRDNFERLDRNCGRLNNIRLNNVGVSSRPGNLTFHRNLKSNTSSFHSVNTNSQWAKKRSLRHNVTPEQFTEKSYDVPVIALDDYTTTHDIDRIHLLKIDTQGHEDEVLAGALNILQTGKIDIIETELIVGDAYTKSLSFYALEKILIPTGYKFYALDKGGDLLSTPELSFNAIYVHNRLLS